MRHIIPISGKDSLATAIVQKRISPNIEYEYVFNPTGAELPEVFEWLDKVEVYLGAKIERVGENLIEIIEDNGFFLPSRYARYCTRQSKIEPFEKWIGKDDCTVYYGIRADENRGGYDNARYPNIIPNYPLKEVGYGIDNVYEVISEVGLKPPTFFWESVFDEVCLYTSVEDIKQLLKVWKIDMIFSWRTRANCYFCFNQRKYEWVGLLEHHPELFWEAERLEHSESEYYWNGKDYPLTKIVENKERIKSKRVAQIRKLIKLVRDSQVKQLSFFDITKEDGFVDFFNTTSCGLFCGK